MDYANLKTDLKRVYVEQSDDSNHVFTKLKAYYEDEIFGKTLLSIITDETLPDHEAKLAAIRGFRKYFEHKWQQMKSKPPVVNIHNFKQLVTNLFELVLLNEKMNKDLRLEVVEIIKSVCSSDFADVWFYGELLKCLQKDVTNDSWILYKCIYASCILFNNWSMYVGYENAQYQPVFENIINSLNKHFKHLVDCLCADKNSNDTIKNLTVLLELYNKFTEDMIPMFMIFKVFDQVIELYKTLFIIYHNFLKSYESSTKNEDFTIKMNEMAINAMVMVLHTLSEGYQIFDNHYKEFRCLLKQILDTFNQDGIFDKSFRRAMSLFFYLHIYHPLEDAQNSMKSLFDNYFLPNLQPSECEIKLYSNGEMTDSTKNILELPLRRKSGFYPIHMFTVFSTYDYPVDDWLIAYMDSYFEDYKLDPVVNWKSKSSAILLYMCLKDVDEKFIKSNSKTSRAFGNRKEMFSYLTNELRSADFHHPVYLCDCMRVLSKFLDINYMRPYNKEQEQTLLDVLNGLKFHKNNYVSACATELRKKIIL